MAVFFWSCLQNLLKSTDEKLCTNEYNYMTPLLKFYKVLQTEVSFFSAGHFEKDGSVMSQVQLRGGVDLCDNLPSSETIAALSQNLNDTSLTQAQNVSLSQEAAGEGRESIQKASLGSNEEVEGKAADAGGDGEAEEDEDVDEVMMEEEEEEVSEGSSALIRCQSPDTPMTDSSYSETGMH